MWHSLRAKKWYKNTEFNKYIGCELSHFKKHIEKRFKKGMTWKNYGKWEIDHIIPLSSAKTVEQMHKLCHYKNIQPLWKSENRKKHAKKNREALEELLKS